jgi:ABC-type phosphate transport system auxiliary subunit
MGTRQAREVDVAKAAAPHRVEQIRVELERKHKELDGLLMHSETLHPSAYAALQGQLEEEMEKLQAELNSLTAGEG